MKDGKKYRWKELVLILLSISAFKGVVSKQKPKKKLVGDSLPALLRLKRTSR